MKNQLSIQRLGPFSNSRSSIVKALENFYNQYVCDTTLGSLITSNVSLLSVKYSMKGLTFNVSFRSDPVSSSYETKT
jgi:hypothetical protein